QARTWTIATAAITDVGFRDGGRLVKAPRHLPRMLVALVRFALLAVAGVFLVRPFVLMVDVEEPISPAEQDRAMALFFVGWSLLWLGVVGVWGFAFRLWGVHPPNATVTLHTAGGNTIPWMFSEPDTARRFRRAVEEAMRLHD